MPDLSKTKIISDDPEARDGTTRPFVPGRLVDAFSDADIDRIARRVIEMLDERAKPKTEDAGDHYVYTKRNAPHREMSEY